NLLPDIAAVRPLQVRLCWAVVKIRRRLIEKQQIADTHRQPPQRAEVGTTLSPGSEILLKRHSGAAGPAINRAKGSDAAGIAVQLTQDHQQRRSGCSTATDAVFQCDTIFREPRMQLVWRAGTAL